MTEWMKKLMKALAKKETKSGENNEKSEKKSKSEKKGSGKAREDEAVPYHDAPLNLDKIMTDSESSTEENESTSVTEEVTTSRLSHELWT